MRPLRQSTSVDVPIGPFLDATDAITAESALTLTQPDIRLKKNGAAWAQKNAAQTLSHEENGYYEVTLDATDTDTLGLLRLAVAEAGALPVWEDFIVVTANVWDTWFSTDSLDVSVIQWLGTAVSAGTAGVPNVDVTRISNAAVSTTTAQLGVNVVQISADAIAADNAELFFDGTGYNASTSTIGTATALGATAVDSVLDEVVEGTTTMRQALRLFLSALASKVSGAGTTTVTFRDIGDTKARITATVDADGNRSAITTDVT